MLTCGITFVILEPINPPHPRPRWENSVTEWHFERSRRSPYWLGRQIVDGTAYPVVAVHDDMGNLVVVG